MQINESSGEVNSQRAIGAFLVLAGGGAGYYSVVRPLQEAAQNAPSVSLSEKFIFITPVLLLVGLAYLLAPKFFLEHLGGYQSRSPKTVVGWVFLAFTIAVA